MLPCGHTFCSECIQRCTQNAAIVCPIDRKLHQSIPRDGFPVNIALMQMASEGRAAPAPVVLTDADIACGLCEEQHLATFFCTVCEDYMCEAGKKIHARQTATRAHVVVHITEMDDAAPPPRKCAKHNEVYHLHDVTCDMPVCRECIVRDHRACACEDAEHAVTAVQAAMQRSAEDVRASLARATAKEEKLREQIVINRRMRETAVQGALDCSRQVCGRNGMRQLLVGACN